MFVLSQFNKGESNLHLIIKKLRWLGFLGIIILTLSACARGNAGLSKDFFNKKGSIGLVWCAKSQKGDFIREGSDGLLDQAIANLATGSLPAKIQTITLGPLVDTHYLQKFGHEFTAKEFKANLLRLPLDKNDLQQYSKGGDKPFWIDLKKFRDELGLDYVLYLDIPKFGAQQSFYGGFFATGSPRGATQIDIYLVDTKTNGIMSEYHAKKEIDAVGKWDNPPDYPEMVEAVQKSF